MGDCCLTSTQQFSSYIMAKSVAFRWDNGMVWFVLDQHAEVNLYSVSSPKQQSADKRVIPPEHIIPIPGEPGFVFSR